MDINYLQFYFISFKIFNILPTKYKYVTGFWSEIKIDILEIILALYIYMGSHIMCIIFQLRIKDSLQLHIKVFSIGTFLFFTLKFSVSAPL